MFVEEPVPEEEDVRILRMMTGKNWCLRKKIGIHIEDDNWEDTPVSFLPAILTYDQHLTSDLVRPYIFKCKLALGVNKAATNTAVRGESGSYPLLITI